jgi:hypothetical protein
MDDSCGLSFEAEQLDDLWFATTQPLKNCSKIKKRLDLQIINP